MRDQSLLVPIVLAVVLLLCGYFYLYQIVARRSVNRNALPIIAIILLVIYLLIALPLIFIISRLGSADMMLIALLLLAACIGVFALLRGLAVHFREIRRGMALMFFLYILALSYITVFSRSDRHATEILLSFDSVREAMRTHSVEPLRHLLLNVAMFVPLGVLFPAIWPGHLDRVRYVLPLGMLLTTLIETTQLMLRLGQFDLEDISANTLGALIGLALYKMYHRVRGGTGAQHKE